MNESDRATSIVSNYEPLKIPAKVCAICEDEFTVGDIIAQKVVCNDASTAWDLWNTEDIHLRCEFRGSSK